jgi:hypothetical protein
MATHRLSRCSPSYSRSPLSSGFTAPSPPCKVITNFAVFGTAKSSSVYDDDEEEEQTNKPVCQLSSPLTSHMHNLTIFPHLPPCQQWGFRPLPAQQHLMQFLQWLGCLMGVDGVAWLSWRVVLILVPPLPTHYLSLIMRTCSQLTRLLLDNLVIELILVFCTFELLLTCLLV